MIKGKTLIKVLQCAFLLMCYNNSFSQEFISVDVGFLKIHNNLNRIINAHIRTSQCKITVALQPGLLKDVILDFTKDEEGEIRLVKYIPEDKLWKHQLDTVKLNSVEVAFVHNKDFELLMQYISNSLLTVYNKDVNESFVRGDGGVIQFVYQNTSFFYGSLLLGQVEYSYPFEDSNVFINILNRLYEIKNEKFKLSRTESEWLEKENTKRQALQSAKLYKQLSYIVLFIDNHIEDSKLNSLHSLLLRQTLRNMIKDISNSISNNLLTQEGISKIIAHYEQVYFDIISYNEICNGTIVEEFESYLINYDDNIYKNILQIDLAYVDIGLKYRFSTDYVNILKSFYNKGLFRQLSILH